MNESLKPQDEAQSGVAVGSTPLLGVLPESRKWTIGKTQIDYGG